MIGEGFYRCIYCMELLSAVEHDFLTCISCSRRYPVVSDIPILTARPNVQLKSHWRHVPDARAQLERKRSNLLTPELSTGRRQRIERMLHGMEQNINLVESFTGPIAGHVKSLADEPVEAVDWILGQNAGWPPWHMLQYFYQDWAGTKDFAEVEALILSALLRHSPDAGPVAVLGTGACGIARAIASNCNQTFGVDLSLSILLIAQALLAGNPTQIFIERAGWRAVQLAPAQPTPGVALVAADVTRLPFGCGSMSGVVTQYLMDAVRNPLQVVAEIRRILKAGGIWIDFSIPFKLPGDPPELPRPDLSETKDLIHSLGFQVVQAERRPFSLLNVEELGPGTDFVKHQVQFLVGLRREGAPVPPGIEHWWQCVPQIITGVEVQVARRCTFSSIGRSKRAEIGVDSLSVPVPDSLARFIEAVFEKIDGKRTLLDVWNALTSEGTAIRKSEFEELVQYLTEQHKIIDLA